MELGNWGTGSIVPASAVPFAPNFSAAQPSDVPGSAVVSEYVTLASTRTQAEASGTSVMLKLPSAAQPTLCCAPWTEMTHELTCPSFRQLPY